MDTARLLLLIDLHFKTDCMACVKHGNNPRDCKSQGKCEVAKSYFRILDEVDKNGK